MGAHQRCAPSPDSPSPRAKRRAYRWDCRFEEREDLTKRGPRGYDGGKKVNGRKHHLIVDTQGLLLGVKVLPANITDREGSQQLLQELRQKQPQLKLHLFADGGYKGKWEAWVKTNLGYSVEIVQRPDANTRGYWLPEGQELTEAQVKTFRGHRGFIVVKKRWIVERSFAWLSFDRRLNREYDLLPETTEAFILLSFIRRMIRRLAAFAQQHAVVA
ncbi:MAG: transposase [Bacillota bacterium]|nr:transposase [Deinococcus geothermalis]